MINILDLAFAYNKNQFEYEINLFMNISSTEHVRTLSVCINKNFRNRICSSYHPRMVGMLLITIENRKCFRHDIDFQVRGERLKNLNLIDLFYAFISLV